MKKILFLMTMFLSIFNANAQENKEDNMTEKNFGGLFQRDRHDSRCGRKIG